MKDRLSYLEAQITNIEGLYKFKETKKEVISYYKKNLDKLNNVPIETFLKYDILKEVILKCEGKEKVSYKNRIYKRVYRLERHKYNPTSNKLHFITKTGNYIFIDTPKCTDIETAVRYLISNNSIIKIKELVSNCKLIAAKTN